MKFVVRKNNFFLRETAGGHWVATFKATRATRFRCRDAAGAVASEIPDAFVAPLERAPEVLRA